MRLNDQIYDITAWNLPMLFDVELVTSPSAITVKSTNGAVAVRRADAGATAARRQGRLPDAVGIRGGRAVGRCDAAGHPHPAASAARSRRTAAAIRSAPRSSATPATPPISTRSSRRWPRSTAPSSCRSIRPGSRTAPRSAATTSPRLKTPKVLLAWDTPTNTLSAGWARYALERRFGVGVTAVRTSSLGRANFNDYDVIVLPSGNYAGADQRRACSIASRTGCAPAARSSRSPKRRVGRRDRASACWRRRAF